MPRLEFSHRHRYGANAPGISLPIVLSNGIRKVGLLANVDTGAGNCLFERTHGEVLNLEIEKGQHAWFGTATGRVEAFGHVVQIEFADLSVESTVYFFADERIHKNLLRRRGWLDRIRFGLVDHDLSLYLAPYDFQSE
jgi:hypothetical protein